MLAAFLLALAVWTGWPGATATARLRRITARANAAPRRRTRMRLRLRAPGPSTDPAAVIAQLAALLRSGAAPPRAWELVLANLPEDETAQRLRAVAQACTGAVEMPGPTQTSNQVWSQGAFDPIAAVSAAWAVSSRTGAGVGDVLDCVAGAVRHDQQAQAHRRTAMAAPKATARILAMLPALGLLLGQVMGLDPVNVLTDSGFGRGCLVLGLVCALVGLWWSRRLVQKASR